MVPRLLEAGYQVTVLDNFMFKVNSLADVCRHKGFDVVRGDVRDESLLKQLLLTKMSLSPWLPLLGHQCANLTPTQHRVSFKCDSAIDRIVFKKSANSDAGNQFRLWNRGIWKNIVRKIHHCDRFRFTEPPK